MMRWYNKSRRAQNPDDYETWIEGGVTPTMNGFDNGDIRTTTLIVFHPHRSDGVRLQGKTVSTLTAFMGTGGNNMPMVTHIHGIQNTVIGRSDVAGPQGKGYTEEGDPMFTLDTTSPHAVATPPVRRLTPTECERLQGFPDGWTEGQSDTHRYKQLGNAVAVPVVDWLIRGITMID